MRVDKLLEHMGFGSRTEIKKACRQGRVTVNGSICKSGSNHIDIDIDSIEFDGVKVEYKEFVYLMLNKPDGYISATEDSREATVLDILGKSYKNYNLFPVGRLDKDTEGLLLLTNDGAIAHRLLSPKKNVYKVYYALIEGDYDISLIEKFKSGIDLGDFTSLPSELLLFKDHIIDEKIIIGNNVIDTECFSKFIEKANIISQVNSNYNYFHGIVAVKEGKYHQVKRMFQAFSKKVVYLARISMGDLIIDRTLDFGEFRELNSHELNKLL